MLAMCWEANRWILATFTVAITAANSLAIAGETYHLQSAQATGWHQQVKVVVETEGELKLNPDGSEVKRLPVKVQADLAYVERTLGMGKSLKTVRSYAQAQANIRLRDSELATTLR